MPEDQELARLQDAQHHLAELVVFAGRGLIDAGTAEERLTEYLNASDTARAVLRRSHFAIPDRPSYTVHEEQMLASVDPAVREAGLARYKARMAAAARP